MFYDLHSHHDIHHYHKKGGENCWRWWTCLWHWLWWWFHMCIVISKLIKLHMLNVYSFLHVNHTPIKWFIKINPNSHLMEASLDYSKFETCFTNGFDFPFHSYITKVFLFILFCFLFFTISWTTILKYFPSYSSVSYEFIVPCVTGCKIYWEVCHHFNINKNQTHINLYEYLNVKVWTP